MAKKLIKLAIIRNNEDNGCPYGLSIPYACKTIGNTITKMAPLSVLGDGATPDEVETLTKANRTLMVLEGEGVECPYAGTIIKGKEVVECNYDSTAPGIDPVAIEPASFYNKVYNSYNGLFSYPISWIDETNPNRNSYYGLYSLVGHNEDLVDIKKDGNNKELIIEEEAIEEEK